MPVGWNPSAPVIDAGVGRADRMRSDSLSGSEICSPVRKRARQPKMGKLAGFVSLLPYDVLFEIAGHLLPLDLLRLARTSKEFRSVLFHRSSLSVWKAARANAFGLPDCPPWLSEPQYANLAFDPHCHICLAPARTVEWRFRSRLCRKCAETHLAEGSYFAFKGPDSVNYATMVPRRQSKGHRRREVLFLDELNSVMTHHKALRDQVDREAYVKERHALVRSVTEHAEQCERWVANLAENRCLELYDIKMARHDAIVDRLTALGWGDELRMHGRMWYHKLVHQPVPLTERIWDNIRGRLIEHMEEIRSHRLARERALLISRRKRIAINVLRNYKIAMLPWCDVMPEPADFCSWDMVRDVLEMPSEATVNEESFAGVATILPQFVETWRMRIRSELEIQSKQHYILALGHNSNRIDNEAAFQLDLATTVFRCRTCDQSSSPPFGKLTSNNPLFYPKVLGHECLTKPRYPDKDLVFDDNHNEPTMQILSSHATRRKWTASPLELDINFGAVVAEVVLACGLDTMTATAAAMDDLDPRLWCSDCIQQSATDQETVVMMAFGWRSAVKHVAETHKFRPVAWQRLPPSEEDVARFLECVQCETVVAARKAKGYSGWVGLPSELVSWSCAHCHDLPSEGLLMEKEQVQAHNISKHDIASPELNRDYFEDFASPQCYCTDTLSNVSKVHIPLPT